MSHRPRMGRRAALALPALLLVPARSAKAATLEIAPVVVDLPPGRPAAVLTITNTGTAPSRLQLRAFVWEQENGRDELRPTDALITSPPQFVLGPREAQVARVALRHAPAGRAESAFRLLLDELPAPGAGTAVTKMPFRAESCGASKSASEKQ